MLAIVLLALPAAADYAGVSPWSMPSNTPVLVSGAYTTSANDLGTMLEVTAGSSTATITLASASAIGDGQIQFIRKTDSGAGVVLVYDGVTLVATLAHQHDTVGLRSTASSWHTLFFYSVALPFAFDVNLNPAPLRSANGQTVVQVANADATVTRIEADAYGATNAFTGMRADGTAASPTAVTNGDMLVGFGGGGYDGTAWDIVRGSLQINAAQIWSVGAHGTSLSMCPTANGTVTTTCSARFENDGGVTIPLTVTGGDMGTGSLNATALYQAGIGVVDLSSTQTLLNKTMGVHTLHATNSFQATQFNAASTTTYVNTALAAAPSGASIGETYAFDGVLFFTADATGGMKLQLGGLAGGTASLVALQIASYCNTGSINVMATVTALNGSQSAASGCTAGYVRVSGTMTVSATGNFLFRMAENSGTGTASILAGSYITATRLQ